MVKILLTGSDGRLERFLEILKVKINLFFETKKS